MSGERRDALSRAVYPTRFFKMLQMAIWRAHGGSEKYPALAVIRQDAPQAIYRNPFLADAMVELNLIDTQGVNRPAFAGDSNL